MHARGHGHAPRRGGRDRTARLPGYLREAARSAWDQACGRPGAHGFRNAQVTVLAPTGTIGFMMDCDTTGVEPDIALVKYKQLAGGGMLKIVNRTVPPGPERLGYTPRQIIERSSSTSTSTTPSRARPG
jgi:ribonucleoside-diphosphate reductase alpha chain